MSPLQSFNSLSAIRTHTLVSHNHRFTAFTLRGVRHLAFLINPPSWFESKSNLFLTENEVNFCPGGLSLLNSWITPSDTHASVSKMLVLILDH